MYMQQHYQILLVDDDVEDYEILREFFSEAGLTDQVSHIENGRKAIQYLENIQNDDQLPRLIILDLNMPILNGTQTLLYLKQTVRFRNIPIIIFSTSENETERRKCLSLGAVDYMVKPLSLEEYQATIRRFSSFVEV